MFMGKRTRILLTVILFAGCDSDKDGDPDRSDCDPENPAVFHGAAEHCRDGLDNDCNEVVDCCDTACEGQQACMERCGDRTDNDCDGTIDEDCFIERLSAGEWHTCSVQDSGGLSCWGSTERIDAPSGDFYQVSSGGLHSCGTNMDGHVSCWGTDSYGETRPPEAEFTQVSVGGGFSCGLRTEGKLVCWGGPESSIEKTTPPDGLYQQVSVAHYLRSCALAQDGTVACWGVRPHDQVPEGRFKQIGAGGTYSMGVREDGTLACWAEADSPSLYECNPPEGTFTQVSVGESHACALAADGQAVCWRFEASNRLFAKEDVGEADAPDGRFLQVTAGKNHSCGTRTDGTISCWGACKPPARCKGLRDNIDFGQADPP